jgi:hypothetical protein
VTVCDATGLANSDDVAIAKRASRQATGEKTRRLEVGLSIRVDSFEDESPASDAEAGGDGDADDNDDDAS